LREKVEGEIKQKKKTAFLKKTFMLGVLLSAVGYSGWSCSLEPNSFNPPMEVLRISFKIDPVKKTLSVETKPGRSAESIGTFSALLIPFGDYPGYLFKDSFLFILLAIEATDTKSDVASVKLQLTDLGKPGIRALELMPLIQDLELLEGINLIKGYSSWGLPNYDYGDLYGTERAKQINAQLQDDSPCKSQWILGFELGNLTQPITIQGIVSAEFPEVQNDQAIITVKPYLTHITSRSVVIRWETNKESDSIIHYGADPSCENSAQGFHSRFLYQPPDKIEPATFGIITHRVLLTNLEPETTYYYQIHSAEAPSQIYHFTTLSEQTQPSFKFAIYSDTQNQGINGSENDLWHQKIVEQMGYQEYLFQIHLGDLTHNFLKPELRRNFFEIEQSLLPFRPIFPVHGNHEDFFYYSQYFLVNSEEESDQIPDKFYSFNYQGAYFILLDTMESVAEGSTQFIWLEQELDKAYTDPNRKFTFIFSHAPIYSCICGNIELNVLSSLADLFRQYDVSAGFAGHNHLYARLDVSGKPWFVSGGGGAPLLLFVTDPDCLPSQSLASGNTVTLQNYFGLYEFLLVEVGSDYYTVQGIDADGVIFDTITYEK